MIPAYSRQAETEGREHLKKRAFHPTGTGRKSQASLTIRGKLECLKLTCGQYYKTFKGVICATNGIFPYDFD
jgi:hypothetical protein